MKKLKLNLSPNVGEVLNKKELQAIVGGCKVLYACHCRWNEGKDEKYSDDREEMSREECREYCIEVCKDYSDCTPNVLTRCYSCGRDCGSFGSGSGS